MSSAPAPYRLYREQLVPRKREDVFAFFAQARNLEELTPPWLNFRVQSVDPEPLCKGTLISYDLRVHGIPVRWISEITEWDPPHAFVDVQRHGPYQLWRHAHRFIAEDESTRITDEVLYRLPFGPIGRLAHRAFVGADIEKIFLYREARVRELFP